MGLELVSASPLKLTKEANAWIGVPTRSHFSDTGSHLTVLHEHNAAAVSVKI